MKKSVLMIAILAMMFPYSTWAQHTWTLDKDHSKIGFSVTHLVVAEVDGVFREYNGSVVSANPDFTDAKIDFSVNVASISTDNEMRDNHLRSDDFFNAEKFPLMTFKSVSFKKINDNKYLLEGDLMIRDVTKRVTFDVAYGGTIKDPWGNTKAGFKANATIDRFDYNLKWNTLTEAGGAVVGREVLVTLKLEVQQQKQD